MEKQTFIEPELIKAGDNRVRLGFWQVAPIVDCRVITEDNYQLLKQAYDKMCALEKNTPTSSEQLAAPAVSKNEGSELCVSVAVMDTLQSRINTIQSEEKGYLRDTMLSLLLVDITVC